MSAAELGQKRRCNSCGMKFYDFKKTPIICPNCSTEFDPESLLKSRRGRGAAKAVEVSATAKDETKDEDELLASEDEDFESEDSFNDGDDLPADDDGIIPVQSDDDDETELDEGSKDFIDVLDNEDDVVLGSDDELEDDEQ